MSRAKWKGPFIKKFSVIKKNKQVLSRNTVIVPKFVGFVFSVHNGRNYTSLVVKETMINHKLGEFSFTRLKQN